MALPVPPSVGGSLDERIAPLRSAWPEARWLPPDALHVTLAFLGETPVRHLAAVSEALSGVAARSAAFEIGLGGAGAFGGRGRPRVAWLGLGQGGATVAQLSEDVDAALGRSAAAPARPHLTVARRATPELVAALRSTLRDADLRWRVTEICLERSHLGPPRSRYEVIACWPLADPATSATVARLAANDGRG